MNVGIYGYGNMGRNHHRIYDKILDVQLICIYDPEIKPYDNESLFLSQCKNLDAVSICCPTPHHVESVKRIINANPDIKILVEKPISHNIKSCNELLFIGDSLCVGHIERFNPAVIKLKEMIDSNCLGQIFLIESKRLGLFPARKDNNNVAVDLLVHDIDVARFLTNGSPKRLYKNYKSTTNTDIIDVSLMFCSIGSICCVFEANWINPFKKREMLVYNSEGLVVLDYIKQTITEYKHNSSSSIDHKVNKGEPLLAEITSFINYVKGKEDFSCKLTDAMEVLNLVIGD